MNLSLVWFGLAVALTAWPGCGGDSFTSAEPDDAGNGGTAGTAGSNQGQGGKDAGSGGPQAQGGQAGEAGKGGSQPGQGGEAGSTISSGCPAAMDELPSPCPTGLVCEYGTDPRPSCRQRLTCANSGEWVASSGETCTPLPQAGSEDCPATLQGGLACTLMSGNEGQICDMSKLSEGMLCACSCGATCSWQCKQPPSDCPKHLPLLGTACDADEGVVCSYGFCGTPTEGARRCEGGIWVEATATCAKP